MNRRKRAQIAEETLDAIDQGYYENESGERVDIEGAVERAVQRTKLYRPEDFEEVFRKRDEILETRGHDTDVQVVNETTLQGGRQLHEKFDAHPFCLNFASARNPGGGFLNGSGAQEESLARSSALYPCLKSEMDYYRENEKSGTSLYTDHMIYSPNVPVIRDDAGNFLDEPYQLSFLTAPAANRSALKRNEPEKLDRVEEVMEKRIEKVLSVAVVEGHKHLDLGAWGCGVFGNPPQMIASLFARQLKNAYRNSFREVRMSVPDSGPRKSTYRAFNQQLFV